MFQRLQPPIFPESIVSNLIINCIFIPSLNPQTNYSFINMRYDGKYFSSLTFESIDNDPVELQANSRVTLNLVNFYIKKFTLHH